MTRIEKKKKRWTDATNEGQKEKKTTMLHSLLKI